MEALDDAKAEGALISAVGGMRSGTMIVIIAGRGSRANAAMGVLLQRQTEAGWHGQTSSATLSPGMGPGAARLGIAVVAMPDNRVKAMGQLMRGQVIPHGLVRR